jgi:hypothetical protein
MFADILVVPGIPITVLDIAPLPLLNVSVAEIDTVFIQNGVMPISLTGSMLIPDCDNEFAYTIALPDIINSKHRKPDTIFFILNHSSYNKFSRILILCYITRFKE